MLRLMRTTCDYSGIPNVIYLLNASDGRILATLGSGDAPVFAQPTFADNYLFAATVGQGLIAYRTPS